MSRSYAFGARHRDVAGVDEGPLYQVVSASEGHVRCLAPDVAGLDTALD